jgi:hypothetical protein
LAASATKSVASNPAVQPVSWWYRGAENDAVWRSLSLKDKLLYEIGQKTTSSSRFSSLADLDAVARGKAMVADLGWVKALKPEGAGWALGVGATLSTGPTPLVRWFVPRAGIAGAAAGAVYGLLNRWNHPRSESK